MKKYIEDNLSSDALPRIIRTKDFLMIISGLILFLAIVVWVIFGSFETTITSPGVYAVEGEATVIHQQYKGILTKLCVVSDGEYVESGQIIAKVYPSADDNAECRDKQYMLDNSVDIYSDVSGLISEIRISEWSAVDIHTDLMSIAKTDSEKISYVYSLVKVEQTAALKEGLPVRVEHGGSLQNKYGYLTGHIVSVGRTSVDILDVERKTGSSAEAKRMLEGDFEKYPVLIELDTDENGELIWSSGEKPNIEVQMCEACEAVLIASNKHPYEVFFGGDKYTW